MANARKYSLALSAVAGLVAAAAAAFWRTAKAKQEKIEEDNGTYLAVTDLEHKLASLGTAPIATLTWMQGDPASVTDLLQDRVAAIMQANPWLRGKLVRRSGRVHIWVPNDKGDNETEKMQLQNEDIFVSCPSTKSPINYEMSPVELSQTVQTLGTKQGLVLGMGKDFSQVFWKVSVVPCQRSPTRRFAILVSMSHIIGDGHTFYTLHNMVLGDSPVSTLEANRLEGTQKMQEEAMGGTAEASVMFCWGLVVVALRGVFQSQVLSKLPSVFGAGLRPSPRYFLVDDEKIKAMKEEYSKDCSNDSSKSSFVSTNDIISSWFLSQTGSSHGLMAVNFRHRLNGHAATLAGNYENTVYYRLPVDVNDPSLIRKSVSNLKRSVTYGSQPFSNADLATSSGFSLVTNWASFAGLQVNMDSKDVQILHHLPIYDIENLIPSTMTMCIIFQYQPGQLAVVLAATPDIMAKLDDAPFEATAKCVVGF